MADNNSFISTHNIINRTGSERDSTFPQVRGQLVGCPVVVSKTYRNCSASNCSTA